MVRGLIRKGPFSRGRSEYSMNYAGSLIPLVFFVRTSRDRATVRGSKVSGLTESTQRVDSTGSVDFQEGGNLIRETKEPTGFEQFDEPLALTYLFDLQAS